MSTMLDIEGLDTIIDTAGTGLLMLCVTDVAVLPLFSMEEVEFSMLGPLLVLPIGCDDGVLTVGGAPDNPSGEEPD